MTSSPLPPVEDGDAVEVERCVSAVGMVYLAGRQVPAGRRSSPADGVGLRIEPTVLMFYDPGTRELLGSRKNPLTPG